ncbi:Protein yibA [Rhynchospora pubera]|uniref:Protein yibA n=1 Tax=Rhynchospora pubera TaxID=906938 RepID=A0AAV8HKN6_9POAL|nr:Protein yibA [Rhynchospora pubera]
MGNCMEMFGSEEEQQRRDGDCMDSEERCLRVKLLVTKKELDVLVMELKKGEKGIDDILVEMGEKRDKRKKAKLQIGWKPKLEKIEESHEVLEF